MPCVVQATEYSAQFEDYNYLWLDDRRQYLKQFLTYGHALNSEEELMEGKVNEEGALLLKESPPKLNQFKIQVTFKFKQEIIETFNTEML